MLSTLLLLPKYPEPRERCSSTTMPEEEYSSDSDVRRQENTIQVPVWSAEDIDGFVNETRLCKQCHSVFVEPALEDLENKTYENHTSEDSFLRSVREGCQVCSMIKPIWTELNGKILKNGKDIHVYSKLVRGIIWVAASQHDVDGRILWCAPFETATRKTPYIVFKYLPSPLLLPKPTAVAKPVYRFNFGTSFSQPLQLINSLVNDSLCRIVPNPTSHDHNLQLPTIRQWMDICTGGAHSRCTRYRHQTRQHPTLLLYLNNSRDGFVQIISTDESQQYSYATLSYQWGGPDAQPPKLSRTQRASDNEAWIQKEELVQGIPVSRLPQLFQDALSITRFCGLEYLWIDSLCIPQDQDAEGRNEDWETEAEKVGGIYSGGVFNIAATDSRNCKEGILPEKKPILLPVVRVGGQGDSKRHQVLFSPTGQDFGNSITKSGLLSRGWVHQEVLLTPANLFCTTKQMWWSCSETICSQTFPEDSRGDRRDSGWWDYPSNLKRALTSPDGAKDLKDVIAEWLNTLEAYTATSVTVEGDRLVAIAGLANVFRNSFSEHLQHAEYHSGVWSVDIIAQLRWRGFPNRTIHPTDTGMPPRRWSGNHNIPSWSPLSFKGPTLKWTYRFDLKGRTDVTMPIECHGMDVSKLDRFGRATTQEQCALRLRGVLTDVVLGKDNEGSYNRVWLLGHENVTLDVVWDNQEEADLAKLEASLTTNGLRVLVLECHESFRIMGLLLRRINNSGDHDRAGEWVRCAYIEGWRWPMETDTADQQARWIQAFRLERYGFVWKLENPEGREPRYWHWRREPTGLAPNLEDIVIV